eukprot:CAMPEP_0173079908 /NCGR_PEP_ID=MMETSP1102-20130122/15605_1 /TAXON_ID=49646 /ORGANISM="Geminigera sp., Strain Caron Lab Isolate" /LENGTH=69 /DNA_ID=CAMNT_0013952683 /DNA_START=418 /DNA_END=623 /DNA_ORIENTATION=+
MTLSGIPRASANTDSGAPSPEFSILRKIFTNSLACAAPDVTNLPPMRNVGILWMFMVCSMCCAATICSV